MYLRFVDRASRSNGGDIHHRHQEPRFILHSYYLNPQSQPKLKPVSLPQSIGNKPTTVMKKDGFASIGGSVRPMTRCVEPCASTEGPSRGTKIRLINVVFLRTLSEIKLKRTDTTLDLSQKAKRAGEEKRKRLKDGKGGPPIYTWGGGWSVRR
jgi:hypothetical protein